MNKDQINAINNEIIRKFPYLSDSTPKITELPDGRNELLYSQTVETTSQVPLPISIKVIVSRDGEILKIISSK